MNDHDALRPYFNRLQLRALVIGGGSAILLAIGALVSTREFYQAYLFGYLPWFGLSLGCLGVLLLHHLVSGAWGHIIQRMAESGARTMLVMAVLFLPIIAGMHSLYPWTNHEIVEASHSLHRKAGYLNIPFFLVRAAIYFLFWIVVAFLLSAWSKKQDASADPLLTRKMKKVAGPGMVIFVLSATFSSVDWMMSLEPEWYSTIYGMSAVVGGVLTTLAFCILVLRSLANRKPFVDVLTSRHLHHLGNLLMAFTILWAYMAFSQFIIIWSGNLPEDNFWYLRRLGNGWNIIALILLIGHFFVPFLVLLSRKTKRGIRTLGNVAAGILVMRFLDYFWLVNPAFNTDMFRLHWLDIVAPVSIGGLWVAAFMWQYKAHALLPLHDPRFNEKAEFAHHH